MAYRVLSFAEKKAVIKDLLDLDMPLEDIVTKYDVGIKKIYTVAKRAGLDMSHRNRLIKMRSQRDDLSRRIKSETKQLRSNVSL